MITHVSNFREVKRVKDVVRVFARIRRAMPATLIMVGDGPERVDAENEARELGVAADVRFLGRLDSVASLLQASDLFLLPSQTESFGLAALEAMACGAPVVATRAGGLPEVMDDGVNGILEPVGSVEAMGRRAVELLRDPERHAAMRAAADRQGAGVLRRPDRADVRGALSRRCSREAEPLAADPLVKAALLGLVEGVTEFIPVSSTGHLIVVEPLARLTGERAKTFEIFIQLGAILAIVWLYRARLAHAVVAARRGGPRAGGSSSTCCIAFLPAAVVGFLAHDWIKARLFNPGGRGRARWSSGACSSSLIERLAPTHDASPR